MRTPEQIDMIYTSSDLQQRVSKVHRWFQTIPLGTKFKTPGFYLPMFDEWISNFLLPDFTEKSVLDIGTADGRWAFECEKRNARRVVAIDVWQTTGDQGRRPFEICKEILDSKVELRELNVMEVEKLEEEFDIVLFLGVYYHLLDPILALQKIFKVCKNLVIMEGAILQDDSVTSYLLKPGELNGDLTNVFLFSPSFVERLASLIGFRKVEFKGYPPGYVPNHAYGTKPFRYNRGIFYLWK